MVKKEINNKQVKKITLKQQVKRSCLNKKVDNNVGLHLPKIYEKGKLLDNYCNNNDNTVYQFNFLTGDLDYFQYGGTWISEIKYNGEFHFCYVAEFMNLIDACNEPQLQMQLSIVAPSEFSSKDLQSVINSCGFSEEHKTEDYTFNNWCEMVYEYSGGATLWSDNFTFKDENDDLKDIDDVTESDMEQGFYELEKQLFKECQILWLTFGFKLDAPQNRVGADGWDFLKCNSWPTKI